MNFYLASQSPRRIELLRENGYIFKTISPDCDEKSFLIKDPKKLVKTLSFEKAHSIRDKLKKDFIVLSADTVVYVPHKKLILNKPEVNHAAEKMLELLSSKLHHVYTGYCVLKIKKGEISKIKQRVVCTNVYFKKILKSEINYYLKKYKPLDKAGAYGIQDYGGYFVQKIKGSYWNVVGLPLAEVMLDLKKFGILSVRDK